MKKILVNLLALGLVGGAVVACSSGSSSSTPAAGPAAPSASQLTPPFPVQPGSTTGAAFNLASSQIALPGASGYVTYTMESSVTAAIVAAGGESQATVATSGSNILISIPSGANTITYVLTPTAASGQSQSLQATATAAESYTYESTVALTNLIAIESGTVTPHGLVYATSESVVIQEPNPAATSYSKALSACTGIAGTASTISAAKTNGVVYVSVGTESGSVCVLSGTNGEFTNLSSQAPAGKYTAGNVNSFGLPSTLNTSTNLLGYWNVGTVGSAVNLYRITGTYVNGTPTGNGFLNTTLAGAQTTTNGTTQVTFTGFPTNSSIYTSYVDNTGNLWVGTTNGKVYVLRVGATQWTNTTIPGTSVTNVTVSSNGTASGATAVALVGGSSTSFSVN